MLSSSLDALLKLSKTSSHHKLFDYNCVRLYCYFVSLLLNYSNFFEFFYSINFVFDIRPYQDNKKKQKKHVFILYSSYKT